MFKREKVFTNFYFQCFAILLINLIVYEQNSTGDFVFDDSVTILKNKDVSNLASDWRNVFQNDYWGTKLSDKNSHKSYRPLTILTFRLEHKYNDNSLNSSNMKKTNFTIHAINCWLILFFYNLVFNGGNQIVGFLSVILFVVHPIHSEAVAGIVSRADLISAFFFLVIGISYFSKYSQEYKDFKVIDFLLLILLSFLAGIAVLFKENGIMILPTIVACEMIRHINFKNILSIQHLPKNVITRLVILATSTLVILYLRLRIQNFESPKFKVEDNPIAAAESFLTRILSQNYLYCLNFFLLLCPIWLSFDWSFGCVQLIESFNDYRIIFIVIFYLGLVTAIFLGIRNKKLMLSLALMIVPFLPATGIIRLGFVVAERILYVPSIGFSYLVGLGFMKLYKRFKRFRYLLIASLFLFLISHTLKTRARVIDWKSEYSLFTSGLDVCPNNAKVYYNIGRILYDKHDSERALQFYKKAIDLHKNYESAHMNLGNLYREMEEFGKAKFHLQRAVEILEEFPTAWMNLGIVQAMLKDFNQSEISYSKALSYKKNYPNCYYNLGNLYIDMQNYSMALKNWHKTVSLQPDHQKAWSNILAFYDNKGMHNEVLRFSEVALNYLPNDTNILFSRANVFGKMEKFEESEQLFKQIISLKPENGLYHANLGVLYHRWYMLKQKTNQHLKHNALKYYESAIERDANLKNARENLIKLRNLK